MTTIPVSTVPAAISYLLAGVQVAAAADPQVVAGTDEILVKLGDEIKNRPPDVIEFGRVNRQVKWETFVGSGGQFALYETYEIDCEVSSWVAYSDTYDDTSVAVQVNARAWQLLAYVETVIRTDPSLGGLVETAYPKGATQGLPEPDAQAKGLIVNISFPIHVEAFI